jgi:hypothetical protein
MKNTISLIAAVTCAITLSFAGCSNVNTSSVRIYFGGNSQVKNTVPWYGTLLNILTLSRSAEAAPPSGITAIWVEVTAEDLLPFKVYADSSADYIEISNIPAGKNRTFSVVTSGISPQTQSFQTRVYGGITTVNLKAGENKDVSIVMGNLPASSGSLSSYQIGTNSAYISWSELFSNMPGSGARYLLYRKDGTSGNFVLIADLIDTTWFSDTVPDEEYGFYFYYNVVPVNEYGQGEGSESYFIYDPNYVN